MYQADNELRRYFDNNPGRLLHKWLHYFEVYDHHFRRYRGKPVTILEIGVFHGGSLQLWKDYFGPQATIYGVDIDPRCKQFEEENVHVYIGDQADRDFLRKLKAEIPRPDILIDDGGHLMHQQIITFEELYSFVADDGIYLCEDLHTNYWPEWKGGLERPGTFIEFSKKLVDALNGFHIRPQGSVPPSITQSTHSLHYYDSVLVVEKQRRDDKPTDGKSGAPVFEEGSIGSFAKPPLNFAVLTSEPYGSGKVEERLFIPHTVDASRFKLVYGGWKDSTHYTYDDDQIHAADGYVIHAQFPDELSADVLQHVFSSGKPVIYFLDESLPEIANKDLHFETGFRRYILESLKLAHLVVVENDAQKAAYESINPRITILPQRLDPSRYPTIQPAANDEALKVIYQGGEGHLDNLLLVGEALRNAADRNPGKLEFHLFGRGLAALGKHPSFHFNPLPANMLEWEEAIHRIQPGLALMPLRESDKSGLASILPLIEYAAHGIPVLASKAGAYLKWADSGGNALLAENTSEAWIGAIEECVSKPSELALLGERARNWLENEHALAKNNSGLPSVFEQVLHNAAGTRPGKSPVAFMSLKDRPAYQIWLASQRLLPRDIRWMENEMARWDMPLRFHFLITVLPSQTQWLQTTLDSLATQINPNWHLTIVAFTPPPPGIVLDGRAHWYEVGDDEDSYDALNRFAADANYEWVGFIEAGDILAPHTLFKLAFHARTKQEWKVIYTDEDQAFLDSYRSNPLFKPDYNPDLLHSFPYTGGLCVFDRELYSSLNGVNGEKDGADIYDLLLRCTEKIPPSSIGHLAEILYTRFERGGHSVRSWDEISQSIKESLIEHFDRRGIHAEIKPGPFKGTHVIAYPLDRTPLVSILIPTRDHLELIKPCVNSLLEKTDYPNYEVLILNNDTQDSTVLEYFDEIRKNPKIRILDYPHEFNFSAICNYGAREAKGEFLLLLNNDTEIIEGKWLSEMVRHGLRSEVGVVGARLLFANGNLQHAGVVMGCSRIADHPFIAASPDKPGYMMRACLTQNYSAVTGACLLIGKDLYAKTGGMDETDLKVLYNDVDLCLKVRELGYEVVWTPNATLIHKASVSLKSSHGSSDRRIQTIRRRKHESDVMFSRWLKWMASDPAYNRNLSFSTNNFDQEIDEALCWDPDWRPAPRIIAYPGDYSGCGEYRIFAPCRALNKAGLAQAHVSKKIYHEAELAKINPDVLLVQRHIEEIQFHGLDKAKRYSKAFRVFELDDLLHNLSPRSTHREVMHGDELERLVEAISRCDRFVTTTPELANAYGKYCGDVRVVPNYLERAKWGQLSPVRLQNSKPRVGWAGGASHTGDLELLYPVIKALHKEVEWVIFGLCPESLRPFIHEYHRGVELDFYPSKLASLNLDLALAPLEYHPFNEAKSSLKILEYGVLGYPVICTDISNYRGEFPVTRVSNTPNEWIEAIRHSIADRNALAAQGDTLRKHIQDHWMLEDNLDKWLEAWLP